MLIIHVFLVLSSLCKPSIHPVSALTLNQEDDLHVISFFQMKMFLLGELQLLVLFCSLLLLLLYFVWTLIAGLWNPGAMSGFQDRIHCLVLFVTF